MINALLNILYPKVCVACGGYLSAEEEGLCLFCTLNLPKSHYWNYKDNPMHKVLNAFLNTEVSIPFLFYSGKTKVYHILRAYKYQNKPELAELMGKLFSSDLFISKELDDVDVLVPVPLHSSKELIRGYNQSYHFAKGISSSRENTKVLKHGLIRIKKTDSQTKKSRLERWDNMEGVFQWNENIKLQPHHILLVDDVYTTGATLLGCGQAIRKVFPNVKLSIATMAISYSG